MVVAVLLGVPLYNGGLWVLERLRKTALPAPRLGWGTALVSAVIGVYSHVLLDSMMHSDARSFKPFSMENPALWIVSLETLLTFCVLSGVWGLVLRTGYSLNLLRQKQAAEGKM